MSKKKKPDPFVDSQNHWLNGLKLAPWTPYRSIAAQNLGMLHPHIGKEGYDQFLRTGSYPGELKDVIIAIWLCTLPEESEKDEWSVERADAMPLEAYKAAKLWAVAQKMYRAALPNFKTAKKTFIDIMNEVDEAMMEPDFSGTDAEEVDEEPGNE